MPDRSDRSSRPRSRGDRSRDHRNRAPSSGGPRRRVPRSAVTRPARPVAGVATARVRVANPRPDRDRELRPRPTVTARPARPRSTVTTSATRATTTPGRIDADVLRSRVLLDSPRFRPEMLEQLRTRLRRPVPRDQIRGPVAPDGAVEDTVLFEDARQPARKLYLPRYRLLERREGGRQRYRVKLDALEDGGRLEVELEKFPAPELGAAAREADELPHRPVVRLRYRLASGSFKELPFDAVEEHDDGSVTARLELPSLSLLTQVFQVLQESDAATELRVERHVRVAVPTEARRTAAATGPEAAEAEVPGALLFNRELSARLATSAIARTLRPRPPRPPRRPRPDPRPRPRPRPEPEPETPTEPLFRWLPRVLTRAVEPEPFVFPPQLHDYVFSGVTGLSTERLGLVRRQVQHEGTWHSYYQDQAEPELFYYLPDAFKLARRDTVPFAPMMAVSFHSEDGSTEKMEADLELVAVPELDPDRLTAAAGELARHLPEDDQDEPPVFEPLQPQSAVLRLFLPRRSGGEAGTAVERPDALVDLDAGIHDLVTLPLGDFQAVWDALFGGSAVLMRGEVEVTLEEQGEAADGEDGDGATTRRTERIPFLARLDDLEGDLVTAQVEPALTGTDASDTVSLALTNAIESPLEITRLPVVLRRDGAETASHLKTITVERMEPEEGAGGATGDSGDAGDTRLPVTLQPGDTATFHLTPAEALPGEGTPEALFSIDDLRVLPDKEAIWDAVLDPSTPAEYEQPLEVRALESWFEAEDPAQAPQVILVQLEHGDTVSLEAPDQLKARTTVRLPLEDLILRRLHEGTYRYKVTVIRPRSRDRHEDWITDSIDILFPELPSRGETP